MISNEDIAWAAGFFEGEGHVKVTKRKKGGKWFAIEIAQVYREPLDKCREIFGGKVYGPYGPYTTQKYPYFMYVAYGQIARDAINKMMPYLFRKGEQAREALKEWKEHCER